MRSSDYLVGEWLFKPASGELVSRRDGGPGLRLEPKVAAVLTCLIQRPGEVVAKEDLITAVWPDTFVTDSAVFRHVSELRRALTDDARNPRYIETVPKRGYRFTARVSRPPVASSMDRPRGSAGESAQGTRTPWARPVVLSMAAALAVVALPWLWRSAAVPSAPREAPREPLRPHGGDSVAYEALAFAELFEDRVDCASYTKALDLLEATLARSPEVVPAYVNVIDVSVAAAVLGCEPTGPSLGRVEELLQTARSHGLDAAHDHRAQGQLLLWQRWDPRGAARAFESASRLTHPREQSDVAYAAALAALYRPAEAIAEARRSLHEEPTHPGTNWALGMLLYFNGEYAEAEQQLRHTLDLHPGFAPAQNLLALILVRRGDVDAALMLIRAAETVAAAGDRFAAAAALVYTAAGDDARARRLTRDWEQRADDGWVPATAMAILYASLGEPDKAIAWLRRGVEEGDAWSILLPIDPTFESLRAEPAFQELLGTIRPSALTH